MAARTAESVRSRWQKQGLELLSPDQGIAALAHILQSEELQTVVLSIDFPRMQEALGGLPPLFSDWAAASEAVASAASWKDELSRVPPARRHNWLLEQLIGVVRRTLALESQTQILPDQSLQGLGLDSLMAVELRNAIKRATGLSLSPTLLFDYPTLAGLSQYLLAELAPAEAVKAPPPPMQVELFDDASEAEIQRLLAEELSSVRDLLGEDGR